MSFLTGRITCLRYKVSGAAPSLFGPEHLEQLTAAAIGKQKVLQGDGTVSGWGAGDHVLDTQFDLAKNIVTDTLHFDLRVDSTKIPGDLLRAYAAVELAALTAN